jgi:hypothetical protein
VRTRLAAPLVALTTLIGLSGCGSDLGPDIHPGSAAVVGEEKVTLDEVDDGAQELCHLIEPQLEAGQLVWPMAKLRSVILDSIVLDILTRKFAEERDLEPAEGYKQAITESKQRNTQGGLKGRDAALALQLDTRAAYHQAITLSAGLEGGQAVSQEQVQAALQQGEAEFEEWRKDVEVVTDPRFGTVAQAQGWPYTAPKDVLSVAFSDTAKKGAAAEDAAYAESLPASQRCGGD